MRQPAQPSLRSTLASLGVIATVTGLAAASFAWTAGWLSPGRLTPARLVEAFSPPGDAPLGHRRNHAKGVCFTGVFEANGAGSAISRAAVFAPGQHPALGRFNLSTANPDAPDATVRVRGIGLQITAPDGAVWRSAMINAPVFAVSTPAAFYDLLLASASKVPDAMQRFAATHPEFAAFASWAGTAPWTSSYAQDRFNGLNAFLFVDGSGTERAVRWSLVPAAQPVPVTPGELASLGPDHLEQEIASRVRAESQRWTMAVTLADPGDPTADPSQAWPDGRRTVEVGMLIVQRTEAEANGRCRDINFDPTILPDGIRTSDDPFPAARSSVYARSYDLRTSETRHYPRTETEGKP